MKIYICIFFLTISINLSFSQDTLHWKHVIKSQEINQDIFINGIEKCDSLHCVVYDYNVGGIILKTTDGGYSWIILTENDLKWWGMITDVIYPSPDFMIVRYREVPVLLRSLDGCITWDTLRNNLNGKIQEIDFLKNGAGVAVQLDTIIKTNDPNYPYDSRFSFIYSKDYGKTWTKTINNPPTRLFDRVKIFSDSVFGCVSYAGGDPMFYYCRTEDCGRNWVRYPCLNYRPEDIYFIDSMKGWAACYTNNHSDVIAYTSDGGRSWSKQLDDTNIINNRPNSLNSITFSDSLNGVCSGVYGKVWITRNGGKTWLLDTNNPLLSMTNNIIYSMSLSPKRYLLANTHEVFMYNEDGFPDTKVIVPLVENSQFSICPNPTNSYINIKINEPCPFRIEVINSFGQIVLPAIAEFADGGQYSKQIDLTGIAPGIYFVIVNTGKERLVQKFVKME